jgi:hypothetical protein
MHDFETVLEQYRAGWRHVNELVDASLTDADVPTVRARLDPVGFRHLLLRNTSIVFGEEVGPTPAVRWQRARRALLRMTFHWALDPSPEVDAWSALTPPDAPWPSDAIAVVWALTHADVAGDLATVRAHVDHGDPRVSLVAAGILVDRELGDDAVGDALLTLVDTPWCDTQAMRLLGRLRHAPARERLEAIAQGEDRWRANAALGSLRFRASIPLLVRHLLHHTSYEPARVLVLLGDLPDEVVPPIVDRLHELDGSDVHEFGQDRVGDLFSVLRAASPEALAPYTDVFAGWSFRRRDGLFQDAHAWSAPHVLARLPEGPQRLGEALADTQLRVRALAGLGALGDAARPWSAEILACLEDEDVEIVGMAAPVAAGLGDLRAVRTAWLRLRAWPLNHHGSHPFVPVRHGAAAARRPAAPGAHRPRRPGSHAGDAREPRPTGRRAPPRGPRVPVLRGGAGLEGHGRLGARALRRARRALTTGHSPWRPSSPRAPAS